MKSIYLSSSAANGNRQAFSLIEVIIVVSIMVFLAALAINTGFQSLRRSRVDAVAMEMAGWINSVYANTTNINSNNANVTCVATFRGAAVYPAASSFPAGQQDFTLDNPAACSRVFPVFRVPDNAAGVFQIASPPTITFNLRGNALVGTANDATNNNMSGLVVNRDIKILMNDTRLLRCVRINYLLGTASIGANSDAALVTNDCASTAYGGFVSERF